tara:strand:- start:1089 stop:1316 length:228 start_codon:yes stop_codon:yes gene_type:complete
LVGLLVEEVVQIMVLVLVVEEELLLEVVLPPIVGLVVDIRIWTVLSILVVVVVEFHMQVMLLLLGTRVRKVDLEL